MVNRGKTFVSAGLIFLLVLSCATRGAADSTPAGTSSESVAVTNAESLENSPIKTSEIQGKDWILEEIRINSATVRIDRPNNVECFALRFDAERISGIGFPNRYFAPYTAGEGNSLSIGTMGSTKMASFFEIDGLKEDDYFAYLANVKSRNIRNGKLELTGTGKNGEAIVLIYR
jgi:heat shock protein HslJ